MKYIISLIIIIFNIINNELSSIMSFLLKIIIYILFCYLTLSFTKNSSRICLSIKYFIFFFETFKGLLFCLQLLLSYAILLQNINSINFFNDLKRCHFIYVLIPQINSDNQIQFIQNLEAMLVDHQHIPQILKLNKRPVLVNRQNPITVVIYRKFGFLNATVQSVLSQYGYAFDIQEADSRILMGYTLPIICFQDIILQKQALIEFIADLCLNECSLKEFVERKQNIKKLYQAWQSILADEFDKKVREINIKNLLKSDHVNKIFEQMINFSMQVVNKGYQTMFRSYRADQFNFQSLLLVDVTNTILQELPKQHSDYVLRGYFSQQIDYANYYKNLLQKRMKDEQIWRNIVLIDGKQAPTNIHPHLKFNLKWFGGIFSVLALVFLKWGK